MDNIQRICPLAAPLTKVGSFTTEQNRQHMELATDSSYLTGTDITYSGARGSATLKLTGTYSGTTGGFSNVYSLVNTSGAMTTSTPGVIGVKSVIVNTGACTDGNFFAGQFIAKHNHATADLGKLAALVGLEAWFYDSSTGTVGTAIGANLGYHNECTTAQETGSVHRGVQIFCDDASGAEVATENTALCLWNMAGTQDNAIRVVHSGSGFTYLFDFAGVTGFLSADTGTPGAATTHKIKVNVAGSDGYIPVYADY